MKAVVSKGSGSADKLILSEVEDPIPKDKELLIKVHAGTVTRGDVALRKIPVFIVVPMGFLFGFKRMKIPGIEFSGTVEGTGRSVTLFKKGDRVFGTTTGLEYGANAEYVCIPEKRKSGVVARKPENLSFEEAAAIPVGGMTALYNLRKANVGQGQKVLIYGASGSVGTNAIQLAKHLGAEVVGVCSTRNVDLVKSIGADRVIDYTKDDFTTHGQKYDLIFDAVGRISRSKCRGSLEENGTYRSIRTPTKEKTEDLIFLKALAEAGQLRPVMDRQYTLDQVPEAHKYVELRHKRGNVVIRIVDEG
ncbi:MAG: NAD(P)-dependent alcohol dehydrogenase [Candidatus Aminicenantes bacterium]|nr:NAD(P)-dependent alcohol dehydrogenase [Candidatus Aminicenantes bacterium]